jgi:hypothetical protein
MMTESNRLASISRAVADAFSLANNEQRRLAATFAANRAVQESGLDPDVIADGLETLRRGEIPSLAVRNQIIRVAEGLDAAYFRAADEGGADAQAEELALFSRARAASAVAFACTAEASQLHEALYEAALAESDPATLLGEVARILASR